MRGNRRLYPGPAGGYPDYALNLGRVQVPLAFARSEYCGVWAGLTFEGYQVGPGVDRQEDGPSFSSFSIHRDLASIFPLLKVPPFQATYLRHSEPTGIKEPKQDLVAGVGLKGHQPMNLRLR
jgi:hypothetical protein